jgi:hypothetical protein
LVSGAAEVPGHKARPGLPLVRAWTAGVAGEAGQ